MKSRPSKELTAFADRVTEVRNRLRLTQREMAETLEISISFLSQVEAVKTKPGYTFFNNMMKKYNVNPIYLLSGSGSMFLESYPPVNKYKTDENNQEQRLEVKGYTGENIREIEDMLYYMERSSVVRFAILEYFGNYVFKHKELIEEQMEASRNPRRPKK
jgi:transcriptional regulator with XRE-family HTH domain